MDESAGNEVGTRDDLAGILVDRHDDNEDPILGEHTAITQDHRAHVSHPESVDEDVAGGNLVASVRDAVAELDGGAVVDDNHPILRDPHVLGDLRVEREVPELTVNRHEELRFDEVQHQL